ncbi:MAG: LPS export ABC transporter periplasmic protein LptC [Muribaculaceae bacterium]|nr:LPS export ABC transporter periplasmic protein LptC [Muribaculaceae bacterium]
MTVIPDNDPLPAASSHSRIGGQHLLPALALGAVALLIGCSQEKADTIESVEPGSFPTMRTVNVSTLVSDSGYTRYHITAPEWLMYDEAKEPHWDFPDGIDMERYDDNREVEATFRADSAKYFNVKRMWRFDGNVRMRNTAGDRFATEQLFWDQQQGKVYSDSFIHIERTDRTLEGMGFESNEQMTEYTILDVKGIFPTPERRDSASRAAAAQPVPAPADSLPAPTPDEPASRKPTPAES